MFKKIVLICVIFGGIVNGENIQVPEGFTYLGRIVKEGDGGVHARGVSIQSITEYIVSDAELNQDRALVRCKESTRGKGQLLTIRNDGELNTVRDFILENLPRQTKVWTSGVYDGQNWVWGTMELNGTIPNEWFQNGSQSQCEINDSVSLYVGGILNSQRYLEKVNHDIQLRFVCEYNVD